MVEAKYFDNANEFSLYSAIQQADQAVQPMAAARQYSESLARLAALREPVDAFFEAVMVNAEDAECRANRYALLARLRGLFLGVADIFAAGVRLFETADSRSGRGDQLRLRRLHQVGGGVDSTSGSIEAIAQLSKAGWTVAVATNQSGIARGYYDLATLDAMHERLRSLVAEQGGEVGLIVYCPHGPDDGCDCRKPKPGC